MSDDNIINMAEVLCDGTLHTPEQALRSTIKDIGEQGALNNTKKILILTLDDSGDQYQVSFIQSGMKMSECNALCDVAKNIFKNEMGY